MLLSRSRVLAIQLHRRLTNKNTILKANSLRLQQMPIENCFQRNYKNFGHQKREFPLFTKIWHAIILISIIYSLINHEA